MRNKMQGDGRVFKFGARPPTTNQVLVLEQFRLAHVYRNKRCEIELERRAEVDELLARLSPELLAVEDLIGAASSKADPDSGAPAEAGWGVLGEIERLEAAVKRLRKAKRSKSAKDPILSEALKIARDALKALYASRKAIRAELFADPAWIEASALIEAKEDAARKAARAQNGVYWGTGGAVDDACKSMRKGSPPKFRPWSCRKDKIEVQIPGGISLAKLLSGTSTQAKLVVSHRPSATPGSKRGGSRLAGVLSLRIGSQPDSPRVAIWTEIPFVYHRPLPPDAQIKRIFCTRRSLGCQDVWSVQFVLSAQKGAWAKPDLATEGRVGIDVGWRRMSDGRLRVAVWAGSDGEEGELALPARWCAEMEKVKRIQSERDRLLDAIRPFVVEWVKALEALGRVPPRRDGKAVSVGLPHTRSQARVRALTKFLAARGEIVPAEIEAWRLRERHLLDYEAHTRAQLQASRKDLYRRFAARVTRTYKEIRIEKLDLREFHVLPLVEEGQTAKADRMKRNARNACLSSLIESLKGRGADVTAVEAAETTTRCHACGSVDSEWTDHLLLLHTCSACGLRWDQDVNAARNILGAGLDGGWVREPYAPGDLMTYTATGPNRAERRAASAAARENAAHEAGVLVELARS
jgi:hypothetical protein